ncbi:hypothetical protein RIR_jg8389.t1 [Rhizophagus irregularis DAOM 181602=DAOM 197198]|nr:hypothetical protein RIR_jg8389.t1 [Rhizophagus irregularis DAOM 181602=DAOM 197198]
MQTQKRNIRGTCGRVVEMVIVCCNEIIYKIPWISGCVVLLAREFLVWRCKKFQSSLVDVSGDGEKEKGEGFRGYDDNSNKGVEHQDVTRITKD